MSQIMYRMSPHPILRFRGSTIGTATLAAAGLGCLMIVVGCGGSNSPDPTRVTPPEPTSQTGGGDSGSGDSGSGSTERGGSSTTTAASDGGKGLEMPAVEIPEVSNDEQPAPKSGGIEMPADADVPKTESSASLENPASTANPIQYGTWEQIEQFVTSTGQITVVDLWSLSCDPCLKELPGLVRLHQSHGSAVRCVAVDVDYDGRKTRPPEHYEQRVTAFLQSVNAEFTTYISRTPSDEVFATTKLDSIPAVLIYDANGKIVKVFADAGDTVGFTYDKDIIPLVAKLAS